MTSAVSKLPSMGRQHLFGFAFRAVEERETQSRRTVLPNWLLQLADIQVAELNRVAVMLQRDRPLLCDTRQFRVVNHQLAVEIDRQTIALHRDVEAIPLSERLVGFHLRR